jgi:hypothetical protein
MSPEGASFPPAPGFYKHCRRCRMLESFAKKKRIIVNPILSGWQQLWGVDLAACQDTLLIDLDILNRLGCHS